MEMCYDGALVMPSSYALMSEDEMTYVEGGGIFRLKASKSTARAMCRSGVGLICLILGDLFGSRVGGLLSATLGVMIYDHIISICKVKYKAFNIPINMKVLPNYTLNFDNYF